MLVVPLALSRLLRPNQSPVLEFCWSCLLTAGVHAPPPFAPNFTESRPTQKPPFGLTFIVSTLISSKLSILKSRRFSTRRL
ncbi:hypothetical protein GUJ93_ZPchr0002g24672 [Zizania palustris]|uniref:Uncharacterized protein n=1 Tax=Zizania palustris TaxID=103762 RepID=A0A8J5RH10_ZIZPA|nr:hypothetical protein GUJ93_ZPchr0002g24672 [Zizania palustris]